MRSAVAARRASVLPAVKAAKKQTSTPVRGRSARAAAKPAKDTRPAAPVTLDLCAFTVPTVQGPFRVLTDAEGAVRWCGWADDEAVQLAAVQRRWYRTTTLTVHSADIVEPAGAAGAESAAVVKGRQAVGHLNAFFNPPTAEAATPAGLQRSLDAISIALPPTAAPYTQRVWDVLRRRVPAGRVMTYKGLGGLVAAVEPGCVTGAAVPCRAVGQAMACNPIPVVVPCHRVLGSKQDLHGYAYGLETKQWLLRHEKAPVPLL